MGGLQGTLQGSYSGFNGTPVPQHRPQGHVPQQFVLPSQVVASGTQPRVVGSLQGTLQGSYSGFNGTPDPQDRPQAPRQQIRGWRHYNKPN